MPRFHVDGPLAAGAELALTEAVVRHIQVLRLSPGDALSVFDGRGGEYTATLTEVGKKHARAVLGTHLSREAEPPYDVTLAQGIAGGDKMDWLIEKTVELGVARIAPLHTARGVVRLAGERAQRRQGHWQQLVRAACEQCGRNRVPEVDAPRDYASWLASFAPKATVTARLRVATVASGAAAGDRADAPPDAPELRVMLSPRGVPGLDALPARPPAGRVIVLIGPEGGLDEQEEARARECDFMPLSLGARVLRTETAGITILAALAARWGGFA
jgi:16S rRNA (uracil1498-N3)-methyltransferase